jgi:PhnB protein
MADEFPEIDVLGPRSRGGTSVSFVVHVPDVDATFARAVATGAVVERPISEQYGSRSGWIKDPWGHRWNVGTALDAIYGR